jgi:hypothetical protein
VVVLCSKLCHLKDKHLTSLLDSMEKKKEGGKGMEWVKKEREEML